MEAAARSTLIPEAGGSAERDPWWLDHDKTLEVDDCPSSGLRSAVTTGAQLSWKEKRFPTLGPPRAFQSQATAGFPRITVTTVSAPSTDAKVTTAPCHLLLQKAEPRLSDAPLGVEISFGGVTEPVAPQQAFCRGAAAAKEDFQPCPPPMQLQAKQDSLRSCESEASQDPQIPFGAAYGSQTITTAHNVQGGEDRRGPTGFYSDSAFGYDQRNLVVSSGGDNSFAALISPGSVQQHCAAITTGHRGPQVESRGGGGAAAGGRAGVRDGLRSKSKRKAEAEPDLYAAVKQEHSPVSSDSLDLPTLALDAQELRKMRRKNGNRESARRGREKREADMEEVNLKITFMEMEQDRLVQHCNSVQANCEQLQRQLESVSSRLRASDELNQCLQSELSYLRRNMEVGAKAGRPNCALPLGRSSALMPTEAEIAADLAADEQAFTHYKGPRPAVRSWEL